jgi:hypothetical protein
MRSVETPTGKPYRFRSIDRLSEIGPFIGKTCDSHVSDIRQVSGRRVVVIPPRNLNQLPRRFTIRTALRTGPAPCVLADWPPHRVSALPRLPGFQALVQLCFTLDAPATAKRMVQRQNERELVS